MPIDFDTDDDGRLYADEFGDYATVSGDANVKSQIMNAVARELSVDDIAALGAETDRTIRQDVRRGLESLEYINRVVSVKLFRPRDDALRIEAQTESDDIQFTI